MACLRPANARPFPFPLQADSYSYSNNLRPLDPHEALQVTTDYHAEIALKRHLLRYHHQRCYQSLPHTLTAQWEVVELVARLLSSCYPQWFRLHEDRSWWTFENRLLAEQTTFRFGDADSLECEPLDFIGRHVQEDLIIMGQRDDDLYLDAGQLCFPGNWSLVFDLGMSFLHIHRPVPQFVESGLGPRVLRFLLNIHAGQPWTRLNWSLNAGRRLDTSPETFDEWGPTRWHITSANAGREVHLRVEEQCLFRLPRSHSLLFTIHTYLLPLEDLVKEPQWAARLYNVLRTLPQHILEYKGLAAYRDATLAYLEGALC